MTNYNALFKIGQPVRWYNSDFDVIGNRWNKATVKEIHNDHIVINITDIDVDMWVEDGFGLDRVYPEYNF